MKTHRVTREDAPDIASKTLDKVFANIDKFNPSRAKFSTWIFTIADHLAIDSYRKQKNQNKGAGQILSIDEELVPAHNDTPPEYVSRNPALKDLFLKAFRTLSEEDQTVLNLGAREVSQAEIGEILGKSAEAIKVQAHRARQRLQKAVENLGKEMSVDTTGADWAGLKNLKGQKEAGI
jgi:RNA polymerase sigma-70 factor (ECF subfamily)